jgi:hypothetical protein
MTLNLEKKIKKFLKIGFNLSLFLRIYSDIKDCKPNDISITSAG